MDVFQSKGAANIEPQSSCYALEGKSHVVQTTLSAPFDVMSLNEQQPWSGLRESSTLCALIFVWFYIHGVEAIWDSLHLQKLHRLLCSGKTWQSANIKTQKSLKSKIRDSSNLQKLKHIQKRISMAILSCHICGFSPSPEVAVLT